MSVRKYAVGDRVVLANGARDFGLVVEVRQDLLPYRVDFGAPWTPAWLWWSGPELEPAPAPDPWAAVAIAAAVNDFAALVRDPAAAHDRTVAEATRVELARAWAEEQVRPAVVKVPRKPVDLFGPGWRERDPMRKAGPR